MASRKPDRKSVLIFRPAMGQGGADRVTLTLLQRLDRDLFAPALVLVKRQGEYLDDVPADVPVHSLDAASLWTAWIPLLKLLKTLQPDVLFSTCSGANMPAALAHLLGRHPSRLVLSERNVLLHGPLTASRLVQLPVKRLLYPHADAMTAVSQGVKDDLVRRLGLPPDRIDVVYNPVVTGEMARQAAEPVDHPWFQEDVPVVLAAGRLVPQKDYPTMLRAFAQIRARRRARLVVLGDGPLKMALTSTVRTLGLEDDVWFAGFDKNPFRYMARAALFVLSSRQEGLPGALIQAMACGTPVIATDCPAGPSEIVTHGADGFLVPVGDAAGIAGHALELLGDPEVRRRMGRQARASAQRFAAPIVLARYQGALLGAAPPVDTSRRRFTL